MANGRERVKTKCASKISQWQGFFEFQRTMTNDGESRNRGKSFPTNLMAGPLGFHEHPFFELEDRAAASAPTVAFAGQP
jgi:hypothetical protein